MFNFTRPIFVLNKKYVKTVGYFIQVFNHVLTPNIKTIELRFDFEQID